MGYIQVSFGYQYIKRLNKKLIIIWESSYSIKDMEHTKIVRAFHCFEQV